MPGPKLNERPVLQRGRRNVAVGDTVAHDEKQGTKAVARYIRISPYKVREVLDLIRGQEVNRALEILRFSERDAAFTVGKVLASAVANAEHNDQLVADELFVSACFADEGPTLKRWRPRARGRATRIRKRTCHITVIVARLPDAELSRRRAASTTAGRRARRTAASQAQAAGGTTAAAAEQRRRRLGRRRAQEHVHDHDEHDGHDHGDHEGHDHEEEEPTTAEVAEAADEAGAVDETADVAAAAEETLADEPAAVQEEAAAEVAEASADAAETEEDE
jgi:large subunit ribosomal protein L22